MIKISCDDEFIKNNISSLLYQKKLLSNLNSINKYLFEVKIVNCENNLEFCLGKKKIFFSLPKNLNEIFEKFLDLISNEKIYIQKNEYYPFKNLIKSNQKNIYLSEIQNTIICYLLLYSDTGIKKIDLIKTVWPNDKEIFFNKLDTHLTNLKNYLNKEGIYDFKFMSKAGIIKLIID